jgi:hypothetical protein
MYTEEVEEANKANVGILSGISHLWPACKETLFK